MTTMSCVQCRRVREVLLRADQAFCTMMFTVSSLKETTLAHLTWRDGHAFGTDGDHTVGASLCRMFRTELEFHRLASVPAAP